MTSIALLKSAAFATTDWFHSGFVSFSLILWEPKFHFTLVSLILWKRTFISVRCLKHREAELFFGSVRFLFTNERPALGLLQDSRFFNGLFKTVVFFSEPPRGGTGFSNQQAGCHLLGVYRVPRAGLEAWLWVHITFVSGLFVVVVASTRGFFVIVSISVSSK